MAAASPLAGFPFLKMNGLGNEILVMDLRGREHVITPAEARAIMLNVHHSGIGLAGLYTRDVAETKQRAAQRLAEQQEFPLLVTVEPEPEGAKL